MPAVSGSQERKTSGRAQSSSIERKGRAVASKDTPAVKNGAADTSKKAGRASRFWRFPVTRIVLFALLLLVFWAIFAVAIWPLDPFDYKYWAAPLAAVSALALMGRIDGRTLAGFGFSRWPRALGETALGFAVGGLTMSAIVGIMALKGWYHGRPEMMTGALASSLGNTLAIFFALAIFEEAVYRGYFFQTLERRWGSDIAFAATMVTFGLMHLTIDIPGASTSLKLIGALSIAVEAGILFAAAYLLTRRLWMPIGIHCAWNFFEGPVYGTPVTGSNLGQTLFDGHVTGPAWATGGGFGPEASIPALLVGTAIGLLMLWIAQRRRHRLDKGRSSA